MGGIIDGINSDDVERIWCTTESNISLMYFLLVKNGDGVG